MSEVTITKQKTRVVADVTGDEKLVDSAYTTSQVAAQSTSKWEVEKALIRNKVDLIPNIEHVDCAIIHGSENKVLEIVRSSRRKALTQLEYAQSTELVTEMKCPPLVLSSLQLTITGTLAHKVLKLLEDDISNPELKVKNTFELSPSFEVDSKSIIESANSKNRDLIKSLRSKGIFAAAVEAKLSK